MKCMHRELRRGVIAGALIGGMVVLMPSRALPAEGKAQASEHPVAAGEIVALKCAGFEIPDSLDIRMVRIEKGELSMGSPAGEAGRRDDENQHAVTISRPFYMAETEITQGQYLPVMIPQYTPFFAGTNLPEVYTGGPFNTTNSNVIDASKRPMEGVVWAKAVEFCEKLTERERKAGRLPAGYVYRLPTEAEWEYACRAAGAGQFNQDGPIHGFAVAGPNLEGTRPVTEQRKSNAWGLYDMHGNVYEWCLDWYGPYPSGAATDPTGPATGAKKVARGGCFLSGKLDGRAADPARDQSALRSAARGKFIPNFPLNILGFRPVLAPSFQK